jgi:hypothetical protein
MIYCTPASLVILLLKITVICAQFLNALLELFAGRGGHPPTFTGECNENDPLLD